MSLTDSATGGAPTDTARVISRVITAPVRLTGSVHPQQVALLLAIDVMVRRMAQLGAQPLWELSTIAGDVATQHAVSRAVTREGDNRDELGRDGFAARAERLHADAREDLQRLLNALQLQGDMQRWSVMGDETARAARIAFVRLFEDGLLTRTDAVLDSCPSCETVVDGADVDIVETEVDQIRLSLPLDDGVIEVDLDEPELIVGAIAVAVPQDIAPAETSVYLPLVGREVPIVGVIGLAQAALVVPGHYQWCYELARQLDLPIAEVIDGEGVVRHKGALDGLSRYAARAAATELLVAEGYVNAHFTAVQTTRRCHRCASVLVALRGRHWILSFKALMEPVIALAESGAIAFTPHAALDRLLEAADEAGVWCVSQQLWSGQPIPAYTCLDCGQKSVVVDEPDSCSSCMGTVEQDADVLDARFVAAVAPLVMLNWPHSFDAGAASTTALSVGGLGLDTWALPMAALGVRLCGAAPFSKVLVHQFAIGAPETGHRRSAELADEVDRLGMRIARIGLLFGDLDAARATDALTTIGQPANGAGNIDAITEMYDAAIAALDSGEALGIVLGAARDGLDASARTKLGELVRPLLAD